MTTHTAPEDTRPTRHPWQDGNRSAEQRATALLAELTLEEKLSQLVGLWVGADASGGDVAPHQSDMSQQVPAFEQVIQHGLGQLTRPFGTAPVEARLGAHSLARAQRAIMAANRFGIPAQVHEECLAGFAAWGATAYPVPLSWGASWDPGLIYRMGVQIADSLRGVGVHQGLAPVLDVVRDYRWGRVEETISEDPYLVATVGTAYVRGMEETGVVATLKHFAGYSASRGARNHAPVSAGPREMADVYLPPFETALREGGARSVMNTYTDVDGVPGAADDDRLTALLRQSWGFAGVVVADYFSIAFLRTLHKVAGSDGEAATLALAAGIDVELPSVHTYGEPLLTAVRAGAVNEQIVDRAVLRVLTQKAELGLLDADYAPETSGEVDLNSAPQQELALELARESVVLLDNDGVLPLAGERHLAVVGPLAADPRAMLGCYSFPTHVGVHHPDKVMGIDIPSVVDQLRALHPGQITYSVGCDVQQPGREGFAHAVEAATAADVAVVVVGDRAGLFGRGTSGEGCDAADLHLPGEQEALVHAVLATGTPTVVLVISGRPYALGAVAEDAHAMVQAFFPGQGGGQAIAEVLTGIVNPSGHLPVAVPRLPESHLATVLSPPLGLRSGVSNIDPTPLFPFGHGRSYDELTWGAVQVSSRTWDTDGDVVLSVHLRNGTTRPVGDVVQIYLHDPVAQVARPDSRLLAYQKVRLEPGAETAVEFTLHADLTSFAGRDGARVVEPGQVELRVGRSSTDIHAAEQVDLTGQLRRIGYERTLVATSRVGTPAVGGR